MTGKTLMIGFDLFATARRSARLFARLFYGAIALWAAACSGAIAGQEPILGTQEKELGCFNTTNRQAAESIGKKYFKTEELVYTVNGKAMNIIAFRGADKKIDIVIAEERKRTWFSGRCFDVWDGQVYPTYPTSDGQGITKKNPFGHLQKGVMNERNMPIGGGYVGVEAVVRYVDEKVGGDTKTINDISSSAGGNMKRITRLMLEDRELNNPDSQDAFIASLLQLQFDLEYNPAYYNRDAISKMLGKSNIDFIMKHASPNFIPDRDMPKYTELLKRVVALLSR